MNPPATTSGATASGLGWTGESKSPSAGGSPAATTTDAANNAGETPSETTVQVLVFADGDRARGQLLRREGDTLVFRSERFGELRVPVSAARVIEESVPIVAATKPKRTTRAPTPVATTAQAAGAGAAITPAPSAPTPASPTTTSVNPSGPATAAVASPAPTPATAAPAGGSVPESGWLRWATPAPLAALLRDVFGSWRGKFSVASSIVSGSNDTQSVSTELKLNRKWKRDDVTLTARYDYGESNERTTADLLKANGTWRHQFTKRWFSTYRPTLEWNRNSSSGGRAVDYFLLQQEVGVGVLLRDRPSFKLRLGLAETAFDNWVLTDDDHTGYRKGSVFSELEWKLPWRTTMTNRGNWYYSLRDNGSGWENQFELGKKFSDTLSLSLRNDVRHQASDVKIEDYSLWRVLIGFEF